VFLRSVLRLLGTANIVPNSPILVTLMMEVMLSSDRESLKYYNHLVFGWSACPSLPCKPLL
jgi:hypothetical protein